MKDEDKLAFAASTLFAIIGLSMMYLSFSYYGPTSVEVNEVDTSLVGEEVKVKGAVQEPFHTGEHLFFELADEESTVDVVKFDTDRSISQGERIEIIGTVDMHEGELNIIAEEIRS